MFNIKEYQSFLNGLDQTDIGNNSRSLLLEGLTCYMAGAYRASLIVTYTGFCSVLIDRFNRLDPDTYEERSKERKEIVNFQESITPENYLINKLILGKKSPFFPIGYNQKEQLGYFRTVRNTCAHGNVDEIVASSHVESFLLFVKQNLMRIYPNGTVESLLDKLSKLNILDHNDRECEEILENAKRIFSYLGEEDRLQFFTEITSRDANIRRRVSKKFLSMLFQTEKNIFAAVNQLKSKHFLLLLKLFNFGNVTSTEKYFVKTEIGELFEKNYSELKTYMHSDKYYSDFDWDVIQVFVDIFSQYPRIQESEKYKELAAYAVDTLLVHKVHYKDLSLNEKWKMIQETYRPIIDEIFSYIYSKEVYPKYTYTYNERVIRTDTFDITMSIDEYTTILIFAYYLNEEDWHANKDIGLEFLEHLANTFLCTNKNYSRLMNLQKESPIQQEDIEGLREKFSDETDTD